MTTTPTLLGSPDSVTVTCPVPGCSELVARIERYHVAVEWELSTERVQGTRHPLEQPMWRLGTHDVGTHFHLFCQAGHETKRWGKDLPQRLKRVVYPGQGAGK